VIAQQPLGQMGPDEAGAARDHEHSCHASDCNTRFPPR
jgi:hypothetical protein